jgi:hypothetical protein
VCVCVCVCCVALGCVCVNEKRRGGTVVVCTSSIGADSVWVPTGVCGS